MSRHGGKVLVDQLVVHGADTIFSVPGESFLALLDGLYDSPLRLDHLPPRGRRREHGGRLREAHGPAGHRRRHARPRRDARVGRRAHRVPGLDAADPARRAGRVRPGGARGVPGGRLPAHVRADDEVGRADRPRRPHSRVRRARVLDRVRRAARAGRARAAGGHARRARSTCRTRSRSTSCSRTRARSRSRACAALLDAPSGRSCCSAAPAGRRAPRQDMRAFVEANELPAGAAFRRQDAIDNDSPSYVGDVGIGINPKLAARVREADLLLVVGPRLGEMTTSGLHADRQSRRSCTSTPAPRSSVASTRPALPILSGMEQFAAAVRDLRVEPRWRDGRARRAPTTRRGSNPSRCPARSTSARASRTCASACPTRSSRTAPATSARGCTASGATASYPTQLAPTSGAMGYGVPAAVAAKLVASRADGGLLRRRRRLPDERPGARHRVRSTTCRSSCSS